jgi:holo-[acyl-carrier protein] synthase
MIIGVGIDVCDVGRMEEALRRTPRLAPRLFTEQEREHAAARARPAAHLAARFAAKEAALKALGVPPGLRWHELEVVVAASGRPSLQLTGEAQRACQRLGGSRTHLSISHDAGVSVAVVIVESDYAAPKED